VRTATLTSRLTAVGSPDGCGKCCFGTKATAPARTACMSYPGMEPATGETPKPENELDRPTPVAALLSTPATRRFLGDIVASAHLATRSSLRSRC
jgi:hypothetical protein